MQYKKKQKKQSLSCHFLWPATESLPRIKDQRHCAAASHQPLLFHFCCEATLPSAEEDPPHTPQNHLSLLCFWSNITRKKSNTFPSPPRGSELASGWSLSVWAYASACSSNAAPQVLLLRGAHTHTHTHKWSTSTNNTWVISYQQNTPMQWSEFFSTEFPGNDSQRVKASVCCWWRKLRSALLPCLDLRWPDNKSWLWHHSVGHCSSLVWFTQCLCQHCLESSNPSRGQMKKKEVVLLKMIFKLKVRDAFFSLSCSAN